MSHWSHKLTQVEIAYQVQAAWMHDNDHERCHTDNELLEMLETFNDSLTHDRDDYLIKHLVQYTTPFAHNITIPLAGDHIEYVTSLLTGWIDANDPDVQP